MARTDIACDGDVYYCHPLRTANESDLADIGGFEPADPNGRGLAQYLRLMAYPDEMRGLARTYLVRECGSDELVGYFSLKAGLVSVEESDQSDGGFDTVPGIELANFAIDGRYRRRHPSSMGCGLVVFHDLVLPLVRRVADMVGVYLLYIYSLPMEHLIGNYTKYGFTRLPPEEERMLHARLKPRYDAQCVFMYRTLE